MKKPTIYEIKRLTRSSAPYFFDSKTMRHFGQTLKDFHVERYEGGKFLIWANSFDGHITKRVFDPINNTLTFVE